MSAENEIDRLIREQRMAWLAERPKVDMPGTSSEFVQALREQWAYYRRVCERLDRAQKLIQSMVLDCQDEMKNCEKLAKEIQMEESDAREPAVSA